MYADVAQIFIYLLGTLLLFDKVKALIYFLYDILLYVKNIIYRIQQNNIFESLKSIYT